MNYELSQRDAYGMNNEYKKSSYPQIALIYADSIKYFLICDNEYLSVLACLMPALRSLSETGSHTLRLTSHVLRLTS